MKVYLIWLAGVILWNYGFPSVPPILDVFAAVGLSLISINMKRLFA